MPINKETIISVFEDKLTLMQWLKKVEDALNGAVLTNVELKKKGNATFAWSFDFEDGTHVDTDYVTINEGESVAEAYLLNGHLMIKLTNDEVIDAGNLKPVTSFSFNSQRHLIVSYGDGTSEDLGLIKGVSSFTIDANQHLIVNYDNGTSQDVGSFGDFSNVDFSAKTLKQTNANWSSPLTLSYAGSASLELAPLYSRIEVIGNILYVVINFSLTNNTGSDANMRTITSNQISLPTEISSKLFDLKDNPVTDPVGSLSIVPIAIQNANVLSSIDTINYQNNKAVSPKILIGHAGQNTGNIITIMVTRNSNNDVVIPSGATWYFSGRMFLTLI